MRHRPPLLLPLFVAAALVAGCAADTGVQSKRADTAAPATNGSAPGTTGPASTVPGSVPATEPGSGSTGDGVGDSLFPALGNPGVDVQHYDVHVTYDAVTDQLQGDVTLSVHLSGDRPTFSLDAAGLTVTAVTVDGKPAKFSTDAAKLRITPASAPGSSVEVEVVYHVKPTTAPSAVGIPDGWFNTPGGSYVLDEPDGARSWLPCNDHPSDKATYTFTITVGSGVTAVANGVQRDHRTENGHEVWVWQEDRPMATYLIQVLTGAYDIVEGTGPHGLPLVSAVLTADHATMQPFIDVTGEQIAFFEKYFGTFPLDRYGIAITDSFSGLAMETQERSLFSRDDFSGGRLDPSTQLFLSHELTHQWFGDAVTPARWRDIWLNESFATYGQWMWGEHVGNGSVADSAAAALASRPPGSSADPTVDQLFSYNSYDGGAVVLQALRLTIGDASFFQLLQQWVIRNNGTSRTTDDFVKLASQISGKDLTKFFATWLFADQPPSSFPAAA